MKRLDSRTRQVQLARAALDAIADTGVHGLSLAAVARRLGLVPSAIYRHFPDRAALLDAAVELVRERLNALVAGAAAGARNPLDALGRLLARHARLIAEHPAIPRLVFSEDVLAGSPDRRARLHGAIAGYLARVGEIVRDGQRHGCIRPSLRPRDAAFLILGVVQPSALLWTLGGRNFDLERHVRAAWLALKPALEAPPQVMTRSQTSTVRRSS